ncbi:MAG: hypothetical protein OEM26_02380 [Saprospiraceae bacterium]|nr:hypothetical protein [Saprospiraceae bacterium]
MERLGFLFLTWVSLPLLIISQPTDQQLIQAFQWRCIGPANQGGRIVDIEALDSDFSQVWFATGSGGVWHSDNSGTTWTPIFDHYTTASIGDIAIFQADPRIIWVGTGESNNRNSVSWGDGVFRSDDGGKTFNNIGLTNTHHISRIILHPTDVNTAYVAAMGHLWGYNEERGLYKTTDGGATWSKLARGLPEGSEVGCTDLVMDPSNPNILYAAFYERLRQPWHFESGGENGGIFKSTNGGRTWKKLRKGLPDGATGRIGLAIYRSNPEIVMALVEAKQTGSLDTLGSGIYRSENGGSDWSYVNTYNNRPFYYSQIRINPTDHQRVYVLTTRFMVSEDGGRTLRNGSEDQEVHGDFHALWIDPNDGNRYYLGADKGASLTYDHGKNFLLFDNFAIGQFYRINADHRDPYYVYGGLQDNGTYGVASFARDARGILNDHNWKLHWGDGQFISIDPRDWRKVYTSTENGSIFTYDPLTHKMERIQPGPHNITNYEEAIPDSVRNEGQEFRFNWTSPFVMSPHNPSTLYLAGNYVFQSTDAGNNWTVISPDISTNHPEKRVTGQSGGLTPDNSGAEHHCAAYTLSVSPIDPRLIWVGTDDGNLQMTRDGGRQWTNLRSKVPDVPNGLWVSRVEASHHDPGTVYVTFDGHRSDNFQPWIFRGENYGDQWKNLTASLPPQEVLRVVREDRINPNLLFLGSETGIWISVNGGGSWQRLMGKMPTVSVYDMLVHPRDNDLIAGTHGRSMWVMDDISPLQQLDSRVLSSPAWLFDQKVATIWENTSRGGQRGHFWFAGENPPTIRNTSSIPRARFDSDVMISYYLGSVLQDTPTLEISDPNGAFRFQTNLDNTPGIHRYMWNREFDSDWLPDDKREKVQELFNDLTSRISSSSLRNAKLRFEEAKTARDQRAAIQSLTMGNLSVNLDATYGLPIAESGVYILKLTANGQEYLRKLVIRDDPILRE